MIALTKCLDPERDYVELAPELELVDAVGIGEQHNHRRFEYSLALRAIAEHRKTHRSLEYLVLDVGGAGSPFSQIVPYPCQVIDPKINLAIEELDVPAIPADAVITISTIEHVPSQLPFLDACARALAPGGLLFLTMDCCDYDGDDTSHFRWLRERIYGPHAWGELLNACLTAGFQGFGGADPIYHGDHVYDYSFRSLALTKRA
jgi:SAM-dependent methyltransferase